MGVARAVALSANAHTNVDLRSWREKLSSAPVRFAWFPEGLFVVRAMTGETSLLGARVLAIDGIDPEALEREAARYFAGTPEYVRAANPVLLESPDALNVMHPEASAEALVLAVEDGAGRAGDRLEFWAEGTPARLPNSRIRIGVSTGFHDWVHGCRALRCYWPDFF